MAAVGVHFRHVEILSDRTQEECVICWQPLGSKATAHPLVDKGHHVFHKHCLFVWLKNKDSCPLCLHKITTQPPFFLFYVFPDFRISYPNTELRRRVVAQKIAEVYAFFLIKLAHQSPVLDTFLNLGISVERFSRGETNVPTKQIEIFVKVLEQGIVNRLEDSEKRESIVLNVVYSPERKGVLWEAFHRAQIDWDKYSGYFPRHTEVKIRADDQRIYLMGSFSLSEENTLEIKIHD